MDQAAKVYCLITGQRFTPFVPEWRNWQTRETQNLVRVTPSVGSIPSSGTIAILNPEPREDEPDRNAAE